MFGIMILTTLAILVGLASLLKFAALAANREVNRYVDQELRTLPVLTNVHIYKGALIGLSGGYARGLVAGDKFAGIAYEEIDNTGGASGAKTVRVFTQGDFEHALTGAAVANNKAPVYATEDQTISLAPNGSFVGYQVDVPAANKIVLRLVTAPMLPMSTGGIPIGDVGAVAATGNNQATAAALPSAINVVSDADATKGVKLPTAVAGMQVLVKNNANAVLKVYPATDAAINAIAANGALSMAAYTTALFTATAAGQWYTTPLLPS